MLLFKKANFIDMPLMAAVVLSLFFWLGSPGLAHALTLGDMMCSASNNVLPFGKLFQWVAYVAGAACTVQGIYHFRGHTESPQNFPLNRALLLWFGAMCLLSLPSVLSTIVLSLYGTGGGSSGSLTCASPGSGGGGGATLDAMLANFVSNIKGPLLSLISVISIVSGLFMIVHGLMKASKHGIDPRTHSINSILANIVFGALLMTIGQNLDMIMGSVFGSSDITPSSSVLSWSFVTALGGASTQFETAVQAALTFIQLIGAIAFVRGWLIMKKVVEGGGQATMAQGITHIVGGVLAINIFAFLQIMNSTFGTNMM